MKWTSVRVRLTLWNVGVMALVLAAFAGTLYYSVNVSLAASVDRELAERARAFAAQWSQFDDERRVFERPDRWFSMLAPDPLVSSESSVPPEMEALPMPDTSTARSSGTPGRTGSVPERGQEYLRPRLLDLDGHPLIPLSGDEPWDPLTFAVSTGEVEQYSTVTVEAEPVRVFSAPLYRDGEIEGVIQLARPLTEQRRLLEGLVRTLMTLIPLSLLIAGMGGLFLTNRALRPVRQITEEAAKISAEDLSRRLEVTGHDELGELAVTFNAMVARLDTAFQQMETAYEQQRRFTADASHELRTPLTTIKANTSLALSGPASVDSYREALQAADEAADTMNRIVQDLLLLARSDGGQLHLRCRPTSVAELFERVTAALRGREGAPIVTELSDPSLEVFGDAHHLQRLLTNLLENALRHTPADGSVTLSAEASSSAPEILLRVADTGEGIAPEHLPHVCERFYRVDAARVRSRGGTGLGLAICQSIVQAHGGHLSIQSQVGQGTTVTVALSRVPVGTEVDE